MKKLLLIFTALMVLVSSVGVSAMGTEKAVGEVLYHQDFSHITDFNKSGLKIGTLSSDNSFVTCASSSLEIFTYDDGRVYVILPEIDKGNSNSFTYEFTFRFKDIHSTNGFVSPLLTCRGNEPSNITYVNIRATGDVDDFSGVDDNWKTAISGGKTVTVKIPVENGAMHRMVFEIDGEEYTVERNSVQMVANGSLGLTVRNADVEIDEIFIVNGTNYTEKSGYYVDNSFASDESSSVGSDCGGNNGECAPDTGDNINIPAIVAIVAGIGLVALGVMGRRRR